LIEGGFAGGAAVGIEGEKDLADGVGAGLGEFEAALMRLAFEERVRDLHQDAGAVAGARIASAGAAMGEVVEDLQRFEDDIVRALAGDVDDEADAAGIVFVRRIVQSFSPGNAVAIVHG